MDEQHTLRIRSLDGKQVAVVVGKRIVRIDADLAAAEAVRHIERWELDGGASPRGHLNRLGGGGPAVYEERCGSRGGRRGVAGDDRLDASGPAISWRAPELPGSGDAFNRPVRCCDP